MVQTAVADIISPAVTAEGPHALLGEIFLVVTNEHSLITVVIRNGFQQCVADGA